MPYNGAGSFQVINTFTPGTTISSSQENSNNADFAMGLSAVLVRDGQGSGMTGQFKAADGSVGAPGISFAADLDTGFRRPSADQINAIANGVDIASINTGGISLGSGKVVSLAQDPTSALHAATKQYVDGTLGAPSGTIMLFQQTNAPTGWTKSVAHNNKALRIVSGTAGSGGTSPFSTVFGKTATDNHSLTVAQTAAHSHTFTYNTVSIAGGGVARVENIQTAGGEVGVTTSSAGSGSGHAHNMDIRVQYVDVIAAVKD